MSKEAKDQIQSNEHPAAAGYRALRGKMTELWAKMPRMSFVLDLHPRPERKEQKGCGGESTGAEDSPQDREERAK